MQKTILLTIIILGIVIASVVVAQTTKIITVETSYDDNAFRNHKELPDYVTQLNLYLARDYGKDEWAMRLYYGGDLSFFAEYEDRFFHYHKAGLAALYSLNDEGSVLNFGGNFVFKRYKAPYDYTNYVEGTGYINAKIRPEESFIVQPGYILKYRNYANLAEFTHFEHKIFSRFSWFLPTNTSLIFYAQYGLKTYESQSISTVVTDGMTTGRGNGNRRQTGNYVVYSDYKTPSTSQFVGSVKIGQSVTSTTGLGLQYLQRINLTNRARYSSVAGEVWTYNTEDDLFDDPYGYEGHEISATLTQILPWQTTFKLGYNYYNKNYSIEALDLDGLSLAMNREDTRDIIWLSIAKRFSQGSVFRNFQLNLDLYNLTNDSNDLYFNYDNSVFTFGAELNF